MDLGDVHARLTQQGPDFADDSGDVPVSHHQQIPLRSKLEAVTLESHHARIPFPEHRAGHLHATPLALHSQRHQVWIVPRMMMNGLHDLDSSALGHPLGVHEVHRFSQKRRQGSF